MSLLTIVQDACDRIGLPRPSVVVGAADTQVRQLFGLAQQEGKELSRRGPWQELTKEKSITATATETQTGGIPADFERMIEGTFWNRTQDRRVVGPLTPQKWQMLQTGLYSLVWDAFRIRGTEILMSPVPTDGDTLVYEYVSKYWCTDASGTTERAAWAADDDVSLLDEELMTLGVIWRFKKAKGLDYSEEYRSYEQLIERKIANDGAMGIVDLNGDRMDGGGGTYDPFIPEGNWS
jgi:hypothetical protein